MDEQKVSQLSDPARLSVREEVARDLELVGTLALIADYLCTRYESTGFGGYNIYDDSRIHISRDTYASSLSVYVKTTANDWTMVYSQRHRHLPQTRDGGKWRRYVMEILYPRAIRAHDERLTAWQEEELKKPRLSLAPIDDSDIFPDELFAGITQGASLETATPDPFKRSVIVL